MEITPEAIVTRVVKLPVRELVEGVQVGGFAVYAKMCVPALKLRESPHPARFFGYRAAATSTARLTCC